MKKNNTLGWPVVSIGNIKDKKFKKLRATFFFPLKNHIPNCVTKYMTDWNILTFHIWHICEHFTNSQWESAAVP